MLALRLRELTGRDLIDLKSLQELMSVYYRMAAVREEHANNRYDIDDFGFDREWTEALMPIFRVVARRYWRVEVEGTENIPRSGGALLVSNHAGVLPWDGAMIKVAVFDAVDRHARALIATWFGELPMARGSCAAPARRSDMPTTRCACSAPVRWCSCFPRVYAAPANRGASATGCVARAWRLRGGCDARRRADHADLRGGLGGDVPDARRPPARWHRR